VGEQAVSFKLDATPEERVLEFNNPSKSRTLTIEFPVPVSPGELGMSSDSRKLGIGFYKLWIVLP